MNILQLVSMMRSGNPQQVLMNFMQQNSGNNPILNNVMGMVQKGDQQGVEQLARNLMKEKGINADQAVSQLRNQLGM